MANREFYQLLSLISRSTSQQIGAGSDKMFHKLCSLVFDSEMAAKMIADPRFTSNAKRVEYRTVLIELLSKQFKLHTLEEWLRTFEGCGFAYGPVNDLDLVFDDPGVKHNQAVIEVSRDNQPPVKLLGPAVKYRPHDENVTSLRTNHMPPPLVGEHTVEVLQDMLNYDQYKIDELTAKGVVYAQ